MKMNNSSQPPVRIRAVGKALPKHYASQETLISVFRDAWAGAHYNPERLEELHRSVQVAGRYLALPLEAYRELKSFAARNEAWTRPRSILARGRFERLSRRLGSCRPTWTILFSSRRQGSRHRASTHASSIG